ncbi:MAG: arsenate reductase ArsC [Candidatus Thorarchaeota archaeon]
MKKIKVLFICTGNSVRSQMAEGLINNFYRDNFEAFSAGTNPSKINPNAIKVMEEIGIDISKQRSKSISKFNGVKFDIVITVCDNAKKVCPFFPGAKEMIHAPFDDPAAFKGPDDKILDLFKSVRDQIKNWIDENLIDVAIKIKTK